MENNKYYYLEFYSLLIPHFYRHFFCPNDIFRNCKKTIKAEKVFFNALLIGSGKKPLNSIMNFIKSREQSGYRITGFFNTNGRNPFELPAIYKRISAIIKSYKDH